MKNIKTKELCIKALLIALVTVTTMAVRIPIPATSGYIHLGDSVIILSGVFFGWEYGLLAGGLGSMFADILGGYAHWAPFTLIIKMLMGLAVGKIANYSGEKGNFFNARNVVAAAVGIIIMVVGYLIGGTVLKGSFAVALTSVPFNIIQGLGGFIIHLVIGAAFNKAKIYKYLV